jgi:hypothetical protein
MASPRAQRLQQNVSKPTKPSLMPDEYSDNTNAIKLVERMEEDLYRLRVDRAWEHIPDAIRNIECIETALYNLGVELAENDQIVRYGDIVGEYDLTDKPQPVVAVDYSRELKPSTLSHIQAKDHDEASHLAGPTAFGLACRYQASRGSQGAAVLYFNLGKPLDPVLAAISSGVEEQGASKSWTGDMGPEASSLVDPHTLPIFFHSADEITIHSIIRFCRMMVRTQGVHFVVIDNLARVTSVPSGAEGTGSSSEILHRLEEMANEMNSEVLVIERE